MPRPLSQSRRLRGFGLSSPASNWRPRVSSPLTTEVHFTEPDEKLALEKQWGLIPLNQNPLQEPSLQQRAGMLHIGFTLLVDCLMTLWLCRVALDSLWTLHALFAAIPPPFNQPGTVLFCNSDDLYLSARDYPTLNPGQSIKDFTHLPWNCAFFPQLIVSVGQSPSIAQLVPIIVACTVTLKLAFGFLLLRTSHSWATPNTYLKCTALFHLLLSYTAFVYTHIHVDLLLRHHPNFEKILRVSSECIFFLAGVIVCLCLLSLVVVPLLWICSRFAESSDPSLPTTNSPNPSHFSDVNYRYEKTGGCLSAISKQKKRALSSRF